MDITKNIEAVRARIAEAAERVGRRPEEVTLVAVSKRKPVEAVRAAARAGCLDFGENYVQDMTKKIDAGPAEARWHFIGHLQRNKAKYVVGRVVLFHALDSLSLAEALERSAEKKGGNLDVLVEVNLGGEASKSGVREGELRPLLESMTKLERVKVRGLMGMPPYFEDPEQVRPYFRRLAELAAEGRRRGPEGLGCDELSMGMSHDYPVAVEEGATLVRVGTSIFGERR